MRKSLLWPEKPFFIKIMRRPELKLQGLPSLRHAVRAVVVQGGKLLMVYSEVNGDYKFPGGGVKEGESHFQALQRELREETGSTLIDLIRIVGITLEYDRTERQGCGYFKMFSFYYLCGIEDHFQSTLLDPYEAELGFAPAWVNCRVALKNNENLFTAANSDHLGWLKRETAVLNILKNVLE